MTHWFQRAAFVSGRTVFVLVAASFLFALPGCNRRVGYAAAVKHSAKRKGVNVVLVVDRSGSLTASGSCAPLVAAATSFVGQLTPYRDKVGLVTFATSTTLEFPIANTFQTAEPNIPTLLSHITCGGSTSTAQALWTAYQQLIALNQPKALNAILFFTDGMPTGVTFDMPVANTSTCRAYTHGSPGGAGGYAMPSGGKGYIRGVYGTFTDRSQWYGLLNQNRNDGLDGPQGISNDDLALAPNSGGCAYYSPSPRRDGLATLLKTGDFLGAPTRDVYGNSTNTNYQPVTLNRFGFIDLGNNRNAMATALNAADSAAANIRNGAIDPVSGRRLKNVVIYSIGLSNASVPLAPSFLLRVSNSPRSPIFDKTKRVGEYIDVRSSKDLPSAFRAMASTLLRRAK